MAITQVAVLCTLIHFGGFIFQAQENAVNINLLQESTSCVTACFCPKRKERKTKIPLVVPKNSL